MKTLSNLILCIPSSNFFPLLFQKMSASANITILHTIAPADALCWRNFSASKDGSPIHIRVDNVCEDFRLYVESIDVCWEAYALRRLDILEKASKIAKVCPVILYTGLVASDTEAPCGCSEYDVLCDYHRHQEYDVAKCFCCDNMNLECSYHAQLH